MDAQDRHVVRPRRRRSATAEYVPARRRLHRDVVLAGDDVGVRDDDPGRTTHPDPWIPSPQAVPCDADDARLGGVRARRSGQGSGRADRAPGRRSRGRRAAGRSAPARRAPSLAGTARRSAGRIAELWTFRRRWSPGCSSATTATSHAMTSPSTTPAATPPAVSMAASGPRSTCSRSAFAAAPAPTCTIEPADQRTDEPGNAQPGRVPAVLQQHRGEPRPDHRSDGEARQAQKRRHEAALRAPEGRQRHPREHEEVDGAHR